MPEEETTQAPVQTGSPAVASLVTLLIVAIIGGGIWLWRRNRLDY